MAYFPAYIAVRFGYRCIEFLRQWYVESFFFLKESTFSFATALNESFRITETFVRFFSPPHQGESVLVYVLKHALAVFAAATGTLFLAGITAVGVLLYIVWLVIPIATLYGLFQALAA